MIKMVLTGLEHLEILPQPPMGETAPVDQGPGDQVVADVLCCAICRTDAKMWEQGHRDLVFPRVPGHEMVVQTRDRDRGTGKNRYIVWPGKSCGQCKYCKSDQENLCDDMEIIGFHRDGGFAHQVSVPSASLIPLPPGMDIHTACFAEPVGCVVNAFEKLVYKKGDRVLVYGGGTMGLVTALYAKSLGLVPMIIEKHENKMNQVRPFLDHTGIVCVKETMESKFDMVINACPDYIALCQAVTKVDKGGSISFFSGITKNEHVETNLLNLIHYKEATLIGAYGMKKADMEQGLAFIQTHETQLGFLIQEVVPPEQAPDLLPRVLTGRYLKFILDFTGTQVMAGADAPGVSCEKEPPADHRECAMGLPGDGLCRKVIQGICPLDDTLLPHARAKMDGKTKPLGALGKIEALGIQMSLILNSLTPVIHRKHLFVFAGDHGITQEGVSAFPAEVTGQMVENFLNGGAAINVLCRHHDIDMKVVDMGVIKAFSPHPDLIIA
ncbi:MAG: nicotinate-nucleotide--dimethylbenzimidazole phosphoribosyltransferase, partial [Proteobacteria bacterium]|nr:nicotinate-nucleotide--dimethylbenzimidazole phosphoribosyltransferase [Pseudomonadota bacterium]